MRNSQGVLTANTVTAPAATLSLYAAGVSRPPPNAQSFPTWFRPIDKLQSGEIAGQHLKRDGVPDVQRDGVAAFASWLRFESALREHGGAPSPRRRLQTASQIKLGGTEIKDKHKLFKGPDLWRALHYPALQIRRRDADTAAA
ncbi:unnamed protein product [Arctogadus glacialis]